MDKDSQNIARAKVHSLHFARPRGRLARLARLTGRRTMFVALILPMAVLHLSAWALACTCDIGWVIFSYVSWRTEHEWPHWTESLRRWADKVSERVIALNSN